MAEDRLTLPMGRRILLPGHFDVPVILEDVRALGPDGGYECRVRLPDGALDEVVISPEEAASIASTDRRPSDTTRPVDAEKLCLLVESARIRLAYAHDRQFAVSLSGIRTLPHQIEAVYQKMLPQPRLRFLLADDPGAGKTIMASLLLKELKLREAIERILILCPAPLTIQWQDEMLRWFGEPFDIIMINYDLPWDPTRLEQRLGRIYRIGQERDVHVFNFVATDSEEGQPIIEGRILHRLLEKLDQMNEAPEGRVFDVIGEVLSLNDVNLGS